MGKYQATLFPLPWMPKGEKKGKCVKCISLDTDAHTYLFIDMEKEREKQRDRDRERDRRVQYLLYFRHCPLPTIDDYLSAITGMVQRKTGLESDT